MSALNLKPTHAAVKNYHAALHQFGQLYIDHEMAVRSVGKMITAYSGALALALQSPTKDVTRLIDTNDKRTKWTRQNKAALSSRKTVPAFRADAVRVSLYRPFTKAFLYFEDFWNEEQYKIRNIFPTTATENENLVIVASTIGFRSGYTAIASDHIPELHFGSSTDGFQCFPFYTYAEDGTHRRENITDWALEQFRAHYHDPSITKWDIFHYIYGVLPHSDYRERYAANLRRELPPFRTPLPLIRTVIPKNLCELRVLCGSRC